MKLLLEMSYIQFVINNCLRKCWLDNVISEEDGKRWRERERERERKRETIRLNATFQSWSSIKILKLLLDSNTCRLLFTVLMFWMRPWLSNTWPSFSNTRSSFWRSKKKPKARPGVWKALPLCVIRWPMLSQWATEYHLYSFRE